MGSSVISILIHNSIQKGKDINNADGLSRNYFSPVRQTPLTASEIAKESTKEVALLKVINLTLKGSPDEIKDED